MTDFWAQFGSLVVWLAAWSIFWGIIIRLVAETDAWFFVGFFLGPLGLPFALIYRAIRAQSTYGASAP
ncbi:MAG: hypothetical protein ACYDA5_10250 [Vulcanimicrobiaceae bacterium]